MSQIDLLKLFQSVNSVLQENQQSLNKADSYNHDHGDHMVDIFSTISDAVKEKKGKDPAAQLAYASQLLSKMDSGSAQLYTDGLKQASSQLKGQSLTQQNMMQLIQAMMGSGEGATGQDPLQSLLGGLLGGGQEGGSDDSGLDAGDLLSAGLAFMSAKQKGQSNVEALVNAVIAAGPFAETPHRQQSSQLVVKTLLETLANR